MATAVWYGNAFVGQFSTTAARRVDWVTDDIKVMLTTSAYSENVDTDDFQNDVTNEVSGTNYTAGGVSLTGKTVTYDSATNETRLDANDPTFTNITVSSIRKAVFYSNTAGAASTDPLLFIYTFDGDQSVTAADFIIQLATTGAAKVTT